MSRHFEALAGIVDRHLPRYQSGPRLAAVHELDRYVTDLLQPTETPGTDHDDTEALAEVICRDIHTTRWEYAALSTPCAECQASARAVAAYVARKVEADQRRAVEDALTEVERRIETTLPERRTDAAHGRLDALRIVRAYREEVRRDG